MIMERDPNRMTFSDRIKTATFLESCYAFALLIGIYVVVFGSFFYWLGGVV